MLASAVRMANCTGFASPQAACGLKLVLSRQPVRRTMIRMIAVPTIENGDPLVVPRTLPAEFALNIQQGLLTGVIQ